MIRKIIVGSNPLKAMAYYVGQPAGKGKVSAIILDEEHLHRHGVKRYIVYIESNGTTMLWKGIDNIPCVVEYDCDFE